MFTKYDQFLRNVGIDLEDRHDQDRSINVSKKAKARAAKEIFEEHFLGPLGDSIPWVQMRGEFRIKYTDSILIFFAAMNKQEARCHPLIKATAAALNDDAVALMLVAVQKDNLELSVDLALNQSVLQFRRTVSGNLIKLFRVYSSGGFNELNTETIVRKCLFPFPFLWASVHLKCIVVHVHDGQCRKR